MIKTIFAEATIFNLFGIRENFEHKSCREQSDLQLCSFELTKFLFKNFREKSLAKGYFVNSAEKNEKKEFFQRP